MKTERERQILISIFEILYEQGNITEEENGRLKILVNMEVNQE